MVFLRKYLLVAWGVLVLSGFFLFSFRVSAQCSSVTCREASCNGNEISIPACKVEKCDPYGGARPFPCALTSEVEQCGSIANFGTQCKNSTSECASGTSSDTVCAGKFCPAGKVFCKATNNCPDTSTHCVASSAGCPDVKSECASACSSVDPDKPVYCNVKMGGKCTGVPLYSIICPGDDRDFSVDVASTLVESSASCSSPAGSAPKCEYYCDATHEKSGNTCIFRSDKPLTVAKSGAGTVTSSPNGINCGSTCSARFANGTVVTLTATADSGSTFTGWGGSCTGTGTCSVTMSEVRGVTATFGATGEGAGTCEQTEEQICSANCSNESGYEAGGTGTCTDTAKPQCCKKKTATGKCTDDSTQKCAADCAKETGYEDGGTGTCDLLDPNKPLECCKKKSTSTKCLDTSGQICAEACTGAYESGSGNCDTSGQVCCKPKAGSDQPTSPQCGPSEKSSLVPCGRSCDNPDTYENEAAVCTLCHLLLLIRNITDWIFMVMTYIAFAVLVAMGILYIVSTGKPQLIGMAKSGIWAALVGFAVVLLGWVAINVILMVLADGALGTDTANFSIKTNGKWFEYHCDTQTRYGGAGGAGGGGGGVPPGTGPTGPASGNCSVASLTANGASCFGADQMNIASCVCQGESTGNPLIPSSIDKCLQDGKSVSWGLFQINLSAHPIAGLNCPKAFSSVYTANNHNCRVIDQALYDKCVSAAQNASTNIATACIIKNKSGWSQWGAYTKRNCASKK